MRYLAICLFVAGILLPATASGQWITTVEADHPLVGKIWRPATKQFVTRTQLEGDAAKADFALLGETHNNDDHHRLQAALLRVMTAAGRRPAVVFEVLREDKQAEIDRWRSSKPADAAGLGPAVGWRDPGSSPWPDYRAIADIAIARALPIRAGFPSRKLTGEIHRKGLNTLGAARVKRLRLDEPLSDPIAKTMRSELFEGHCKLLPASAMTPMLGVQRARDAILADNLIQGASAKSIEGGVLIAGTGHARTDHGVPMHLKRVAPGRSIVSIAFIQVVKGQTDPAWYATGFSGVLPFDYVWFTPRADNRDHCAELKKRFQKHKK